MMMLGMLGLIFPLLFSGPVGNDLLDYIDTTTYWQMKGVTVTEDAMQKELRTSQEKPKNVASLIRDLGSSSFKKRELATQHLSAIGETALPELKKAAASDDVEVSTRARKLVTELSLPAKVKEVRRLMAIRTLGELESQKSLPLLDKLQSSEDFFVADYAKSAIATIKGKEYERAGPNDNDVEADLACLPAECHAVAQIRVQSGKPVNFPEIMQKMQGMMGDMGAQPQDMTDMLQKITGGVLSVAELVGNIRITSVTVGVDGQIDDDNGFAAVIVRGACDAKAIRAAITDLGFGAQHVEGTTLFSPEDEMAFGPFSDRRFVAAFGPNGQALPAADLVKSLKSPKPQLRLNKAILAIIGKVDTKKPLWAAVAMTESYKKIPTLGIFDTARLTATQDGENLVFDLVATGSDAEQVQGVVELVQNGIQEAQKEMEQAATQGPENAIKEMMKPATDFLSSIKFTVEGKHVSVAASLKADTSAIMMLPAMFFGTLSSQRMMHQRMEMEQRPIIED